MPCFENRHTFCPGNVQQVSAAQFERWLDEASPDALEAFGRAWFPRWFSIEAPMGPPPLLLARGQGPHGGRMVGR